MEGIEKLYKELSGTSLNKTEIALLKCSIKIENNAELEDLFLMAYLAVEDINSYIERMNVMSP